MLLSQLKTWLSDRAEYSIQLPTGEAVPTHFHVTEVGETNKSFIDCGGTPRRERKASLQLWSANDYDHRLHPDKLVKIIDLAQTQLGMGDLEIQVEYQGTHTIEIYGLNTEGNTLHLIGQATDCLAQDACGVPAKKKLVSLNNLISAPACTPGGGCC
ncbi:DUF6428 family protein [Neolewinella antarctica]|uniref:Uncharacterized protein n=1 Tax=Neolewinella antarctica TaxID=442734 RepID=A0ABX0XEJ0_9BACT|nr:DUF6428 family protein [Neolewinella antarctica]NJC27319.1 hypothetical protein [Neolewinella antarctica]